MLYTLYSFLNTPKSLKALESNAVFIDFSCHPSASGSDKRAERWAGCVWSGQVWSVRLG